MNYKMVAIDMDGTLLTPELKISGKTIEAVRKVIDSGVIVTLSTGRMYPAALPFALELQLDVPLITCNGALIKCSRTGKEYHKKALSREHCMEILEYSISSDLNISLYKDDDIYTNGPYNLYIHEEIDKTEPLIVNDLKSVVDDSIIKIMVSSKNKSALEYHSNTISKSYKDILNIYFSLPWFVEVVHKEANKKHALEYLSRHFNIKKEEIIAIGDNFNDMEMMQYAGLGVAMGNAPDYLKEAADYVTRSNDEDGVRHVLEKFILGAGESQNFEA